jgi:chemotaxis protein methyltransferase CheR
MTELASSPDFDYIRRLVREASAIVLDEGKAYLVESRLGPLARREGIGSIHDLVERLQAERVGGLRQKVVEAMTTNETSFFRDLHPFEALKKAVVPERIAKAESTRQLDVWCAAASTGQEPYTIAMVLREYFPALANWTLRFLATDIAEDVLAKARLGRYSQFEVNRGLPATLLVKYFKKVGVEWHLSEPIRSMVEFRQMNLAMAWPTLPKMDIIFIRNVLIYFDVEMKRAILRKARGLLKPGGYLFLGGAETTLNLDEGFERLQIDKAGCYRVRA